MLFLSFKFVISCVSKAQLPTFMSKVSIITVNYNQKTYTEALIDSVLMNCNAELIVVDNGSLIDETPFWREQYPNVLFIRSERNLGFAGGNNLGTAAATGDLLFFVNNDTIIAPELVETLAATLRHNPQVGMVSPKILYYDDPLTIQYAGFTSMNYYTGRNSCIGQFQKDEGQFNTQSGPTGYIHGAAMMVRREAMLRAGLMAENFFLYYEELDWCDRIRRAGFEIWVNCTCSILHKESLSVGKNSPMKEYFMSRNRFLFIRRNAPLHAVLLFSIYFTVIVVPRNILKHILSRQIQLIAPLIKGFLWNLTNNTNSNKTGFKTN